MNAAIWFLIGFLSFWVVDKITYVLGQYILIKQTKKVEESLAQAIIKQQEQKNKMAGGDGDKQSK